MNLITLGIDTIDPEKFGKIKNRNFNNKPAGGLWCSPEIGEYTWKDFVESEDYKKDYYFSKMVLITLKESSKIYKINSVEDFMNCVVQYSYLSNSKISCDNRDILYPNNYLDNIIDIKYLIDYEKLSKDYDALWITMNALVELENEFLDRRMYGNYHLNPLFGWDVETVLLFNLNCIESYA